VKHSVTFVVARLANQPGKDAAWLHRIGDARA
jgi:hypothetical protein